MTQALLWIVLGSGLTACGGSSSPATPQLTPVSTDATVLAFGDSLTYGTGATADESYPAVLETLIGRGTVNAGVPGETTAEGLVRLPGTLTEIQPALVILCLGGNDMLRKLDRTQMKQNLARMIEMIRASGAQLAMIGVPEPTLVMLQTDPIYFELASEYGVPLEDEIVAELLADPSRKSDQIHPNAAGYADLAQAVADLLRRAGAI